LKHAKIYNKTRPGLVALYDIGQEMERVYSYNLGARMEQAQQKCSRQVLHNRLAMPPICGLISELCSDTGNAEKKIIFYLLSVLRLKIAG